MKTLVLLRLKPRNPLPDRTLGWEIVFDDDGLTPLAKFATLEPPNRLKYMGVGDWQHASCIMPGRYRVTPEVQEDRGFVLRLHDVVGHAGILQHRGTKPEDTRGCICLGFWFSEWPGGTGPTNCVEAQGKLSRLITEEAGLVIVDAAW